LLLLLFSDSTKQNHVETAAFFSYRPQRVAVFTAGPLPKRIAALFVRFLPMAYNSRYVPRAQPPEQRTRVLVQMDNAIAGLKTQAKAFGQPLFVRCVAGERSWLQVHAALYPTT